MKVNRFYCFIFNKLISSKANSFKEKLLRKIRKWMLKISDPPVYAVFLDGSKMYMPFSHELPMYKKYHSKFMKNLHTIAETVKRTKKCFNCLDIGANIGDSVLEIGIKDANYLLIEGEPKYSRYIGENLCGGINLI